MRRVVKPRCKHGCQFIQITDNLFLCPHAAYGAGSYKLGAVDAARALLERHGGYEAVVARMQKEEQQRREQREQQQREANQRAASSVRYR
jgi:hypothetical protein